MRGIVIGCLLAIVGLPVLVLTAGSAAVSIMVGFAVLAAVLVAAYAVIVVLAFFHERTR